MPARTGKDYIDSLKKKTKNMEVYLHGRRVKDVTEEPLFQGPMHAVAEQYDMQHDPAYRDIMLYTSPTTGDPVGRSFMIPNSKEDLIKKQKAHKLRTDQNFGFMGRAPDFMNNFVTAWALRKDSLAQQDPRHGENAQNYYEFCRENDLFLTHMLLNPQVDRSRAASDQQDPYIALSRVGETKEGIIVRGAKMVGTFAPLTEEIMVLPFGGVAPDEDAYGLIFAIPNDSPGLKFLCRETVSPLPRSRFDHPLSSRFEEMDALAIFDDVLVPWDRVMVSGGPGSAAIVNGRDASGVVLGQAGIAAVGTQVAARMLSNMEFFVGLATKLASSIGIDAFLHVQEKLGEMISYLEVGRSVFWGSTAAAVPGPNGVWVPTGLGQRGFHLMTMQIYRRMVEIVQVLAGGGFFSVPTEADMGNPEIRPYIDKFLRGAGDLSAEERVQLFKLAWDATGEAFAQRMQQYVYYYSGDPVRLKAGYYMAYDKRPGFDIVARALGDGTPIPVSRASWEPREGPPAEPPITGELAGAYPASSLPQPGSLRG